MHNFQIEDLAEYLERKGIANVLFNSQTPQEDERLLARMMKEKNMHVACWIDGCEPGSTKHVRLAIAKDSENNVRIFSYVR